MTLTVVMPAAEELLDSGDPVLRRHADLWKEETDWDASLDTYCAVAREMVEVYLRRRLITQSLRLLCDGFPPGAIRLGVAPVNRIVEITYRDGDGIWHNVPATIWRLVDSSEPSEVTLMPGQMWPVPGCDRANVRIDFMVGYGADKDAVPPSIVQAVRLLAALMLEGPVTIAASGAKTGLPPAVRALLDPYRVFV